MVLIFCIVPSFFNVYYFPKNPGEGADAWLHPLPTAVDNPDYDKASLRNVGV
jgi:hypothetical protein